MTKKLGAYTVILASFLTIAIFTSYSGEKISDTATAAIRKPNEGLSQVVEAIHLGKPFDFAGEPLPMDNFDVVERLDRELLRTSYYHSSTLLNLKKTARFFPVMEMILKENNIPDDFKYLAIAESDLSNPTSPAGARGYWQFMKATAREYDLEVGNEVDERLHLEKATKAACRLLQNYKDRFGSWTMAAAAYNVGPNKLASECAEQRSQNYYDLNLNEETGRYVFRIVAIKDIMANPKLYGFYLEEGDFYPTLHHYREVLISASIPNLGDWAKEQGITYRMLKVYNPWLVSSSLTVKDGTSYVIKVPK